MPPTELWAKYTSPAEFPVPDKLNLADFLLDRHVKEGRGDNVAILFGNTQMTYKEVLTLADKFANVLKGWMARCTGAPWSPASLGLPGHAQGPGPGGGPAHALRT
jgi:hypothetical protein